MLQSKMPMFFVMALQGARTWQAQTVFPSITLVSHTSMLTGLGPDKHRISWNDWRPEYGPVKVPTIFQLAKQRGLSTAMFVGKEKLRHLDIPGTLDKYAMPAYEAKTVAAEAARYIEENKPNLCFIHFADSDGAGHKFGWGTPEQIASFADEDAALATVRAAIDKAGIAADSVVILTADHGGHGKGHGSRAPEDMTIPWVAWGAPVKSDHKLTAPITTYDTAATALWLLDVPLPRGLDGKPVTDAFK